MVKTAVAVMVLCLVVSPAAFASPPYWIQADIVRGGDGTPRGPVCVNTGVFLPGEAVVWRALVYETAAGQALSPSEVRARGVQAVVHLQNGLTIPLRYGTHPPDPKAPVHETYWSAQWVIPPDTPPQRITWEIVVTDARGASVTYTPLGQTAGLALLTVGQPGSPK
jgi:hypothetical protein